MTDILKPKVEISGIAELLAMGVVKVLEEKTLSPMIGNGTPKSGLIKGAIGFGAAKYLGGSIGRIVGGAFLVDAVEDGIISFLGPAGLGGAVATGDDW